MAHRTGLLGRLLGHRLQTEPDLTGVGRCCRCGTYHVRRAAADLTGFIDTLREAVWWQRFSRQSERACSENEANVVCGPCGTAMRGPKDAVFAWMAEHLASACPARRLA